MNEDPVGRRRDPPVLLDPPAHLLVACRLVALARRLPCEGDRDLPREVGEEPAADHEVLRGVELEEEGGSPGWTAPRSVMPSYTVRNRSWRSMRIVVTPRPHRVSRVLNYRLCHPQRHFATGYPQNGPAPVAYLRRRSGCTLECPPWDCQSPPTESASPH